MADVHRNELFNGNKGVVWINGIPVMTCSKAKATKKINYEEIPATDGDGTKRVPVGHTIEVSLSYRPTGIDDIDLSSDDITIIMSNTNINGTATKRIKLDGITFDEETLLDFEKRKVGEIELSGQAETYDILQEK